jgi:hypothetical protein
MRLFRRARRSAAQSHLAKESSIQENGMWTSALDGRNRPSFPPIDDIKPVLFTWNCGVPCWGWRGSRSETYVVCFGK